jgi:hypothetical protein
MSNPGTPIGALLGTASLRAETVLFVLIPAAWLAVLFFAWAMCRLAALSDRSRAVAWDQAAGPGTAAASADLADEQLPPDAQRGGFRAVG